MSVFAPNFISATTDNEKMAMTAPVRILGSIGFISTWFDKQPATLAQQVDEPMLYRYGNYKYPVR